MLCFSSCAVPLCLVGCATLLCVAELGSWTGLKFHGAVSEVRLACPRERERERERPGGPQRALLGGLTRAPRTTQCNAMYMTHMYSPPHMSHMYPPPHVTQCCFSPSDHLAIAICFPVTYSAFLSQSGAAAQSEDHAQQQQQVCDSPEPSQSLLRLRH